MDNFSKRKKNKTKQNTTLYAKCLHYFYGFDFLYDLNELLVF
jgi:hypothetical protein